MRFLLDLSHTSRTGARTGVQRVTRALRRELGSLALPVCWDPWEKAWRGLDAREEARLAVPDPAGDRSAPWPLPTRLRGLGRRLRGRDAASRLAGLTPVERGRSVVLVPEVFSESVAAALPSLFRQTGGLRIALFHDATPLRRPDLAPAATVARFPAYLAELLAFDGVAAISEESRDSLLGYWRWLGCERTPPVVAIPLGVDRPPAPAPSSEPGSAQIPVVLSVGTIEGRKNHVALLEACASLWDRGLRFELHLVGMAHPVTGKAALALIERLRRAGRPLRYDGALPESALEAAYHRCAFTVYPSLCEGFGLPVAESLARGRPCICLGTGALGEIACGGGCVPLDRVDTSALTEAIGRLLGSERELTELAAAASARPIRTWSDYAADLSAWVESLGPAGKSAETLDIPGSPAAVQAIDDYRKGATKFGRIGDRSA